MTANNSNKTSDTQENKPNVTSGQGQQMWGGRFSEATDSFVAAFTASVGFDQRFAKHDIQGSVAHATMLGRCGILTSEEVDTIIEGLHKVQQEIDAGVRCRKTPPCTKGIKTIFLLVF